MRPKFDRQLRGPGPGEDVDTESDTLTQNITDLEMLIPLSVRRLFGGGLPGTEPANQPYNRCGV
jgi:hypothetical protein